MIDMHRSRRAISLGALLGAMVPVVCTATDPFHFPAWEQRSESVGSWPEIVAIADVTGDGRKDVVLGSSEWRNQAQVPHPMSNMLFTYVQRQDGTLAPPVVMLHGGAIYAGGLLMQSADLDRDGKQDIVLSHPEGLSIAISNGDGSFQVHQFPIETPRDFLPFFHTLAVGDLDGDRNPDIVRQLPQGGTDILLGDGAGGIREQRWIDAEPGLYAKLRIDDVTNDGRADLVMSGDLGLQVHPGLADGTLGPAQVYPRHSNMGYGGLAVADVTRDGRKDVIVTTPANTRASLHVFAQGESGLVFPPVDVKSYDIPETLLATDLDHNGYDDLVVVHGGWMKLGFYLQGPAGLAPEQLVDLPYASLYSPDGLVTGDVNGDGCTDAAVADYNHGVRVLYGRNCFEPWSQASDDLLDFDGDGQSDLMWRHGTTGRNILWRSARSGTRIPMRRLVDTRWSVVGVGDFDGDSRSDLLWRHATTGRNAIWGGADQRSAMPVSRVGDLNWTVAGVGDLDGDGLDDILWRHGRSGAHRVWGGGSSDASRPMTAVRNLDWQIVGVADFDADGRDDVFWRHRADGRNAIWNGGEQSGLRAMPTVADNAWQVAGLGDFDGDGSADVLWRHAFDGRNELWPGADQAAATPVAQVPDVAWKVVGVVDYSGDGRADILWRDGRTGTNLIWGDGLPANLRVVARTPDMYWKAVE